MLQIAVFDAVAIVLAAVFVVSGVAKLRSGRQFADALVGTYSFPPDIARVAGRAFPALEIVTAGALVYAPLRLAAYGLALFVVLGMAVVVIRALLRGESGDCACFGATSSGALSWATAARVLGLAVLLVVGAASRLSFALDFDLPSADWIAVSVLFTTAIALTSLLITWVNTRTMFDGRKEERNGRRNN